MSLLDTLRTTWGGMTHPQQGALLGGVGMGLYGGVKGWQHEKKRQQEGRKKTTPLRTAITTGVLTAPMGAIAGHGLGGIYGDIQAWRSANAFNASRGESEDVRRKMYEEFRERVRKSGRASQYRPWDEQFGQARASRSTPPPTSSVQDTLLKSFDPARHGKTQKAWENAVKSEPIIHRMSPEQMKEVHWFMSNVGRTTNPADVDRLWRITQKAPPDSHMQTIMRQAFQRSHEMPKTAQAWFWGQQVALTRWGFRAG